MTLAQKYLENADNCIDLSENAKDEPNRLRYQRMADAWRALANEQQWLDGEVPLPPGTTNGHGQNPPRA
jgi:hypothetical protein